MRVLGVDPGLARTGVAVVEGNPGALRLVHATCVETRPGVPDAVRLTALFAALRDLVAAHAPEVAAVEQLFFASNSTTAMRVGEARGVALCALALAGVDVVEYTPMQVKESITGYGGAAKAQMGRMVCTLLRVPAVPGPDDVADACAVAICHHHRARMRGAVAVGDGRNRLAEAVAAAQQRAARTKAARA